CPPRRSARSPKYMPNTSKAQASISTRATRAQNLSGSREKMSSPATRPATTGAWRARSSRSFTGSYGDDDASLTNSPVNTAVASSESMDMARPAANHDQPRDAAALATTWHKG